MSAVDRFKWYSPVHGSNTPQRLLGMLKKHMVCSYCVTMAAVWVHATEPGGCSRANSCAGDANTLVSSGNLQSWYNAGHMMNSLIRKSLLCGSAASTDATLDVSFCCGGGAM